MSRFRALLFDLDDTLVQETQTVERAFLAAAEPATRRYGADPARVHREARRAARESWFAHPDHDFAARVGVSSWEALWARFLGDRPEIARFREWAPEYRQSTWRRALEALEIRDDPLADELAERFIERRREIHELYPETRSVLGMLREQGEVRLGLLTNGLSCLQREKIHGAGLAPYFDAICVSGDLGVGKPDPRPFRDLLGRLGVAPERAAMVGDNPEKDLAGARAAGVTAVWIDRGEREAHPRHRPDLVVHTLSEIPQRLAGTPLPAGAD
jgi:putative hydrolase of the HAD superfamily